ncbi:BTAD domain-containing putative transcriptional regulator [Ilumatobacter coccineus]|uniref:BTAD domain-containing putative transcriptional regulator n=1 Tax=Ilumatobacter coccineus TaxID=467094 RepID=UPI00059DB715|nr:BTAD domain-containing putative transcriptional regulator [Ilumatobacter coccineus]
MAVDATGSGARNDGRSELPRPLFDEIGRGRLVERLAQRWDVRLTIVEAAGGFGKSVAIAQAIRDNDDDPSGIDVYARFRSSHDSSSVVAFAIADHLASRAALGDASPSSDDGSGQRARLSPTEAATLVATSIAEQSPVDVCVCLDDVHLAGSIDGAVDFVTVLLDALPSNGHLVLSGRAVDLVKRARLRAADDLLEIGEDHLAFDDAEVTALADRHDVPADDLARAGGWPAVTRLAVNPGFDASREFLLEELVDGLSVEYRRAIFVAVESGLATPDLLAACDIDVDMSALIRAVPLLVDYDGGLGAHDLWHEVADHLVDGVEAPRLASRIVDTMAEADRLTDAIGVAMRHGLVDDALANIMRSFEHGDDLVTADMVDRWVDELGDRLDGRPEAHFLAGFQRRLAGDVAEGAALLARAAEGFEARGDIEAETTTVKELAMSSWLLGDSSVWREASERSQRLVDAGSERMRRSVLGGRAAALDLRGDLDALMELYRGVDEFNELGLRHAATIAVLAGDVPQAIEWADRLVAEFPKPLVFGQRDATMWQVGRPDIERLVRQRRGVELGNARNQFLSHVFTSMMGACIGRVPDVGAVDALAWSRSRERTFVALVHAAHDLLTRTEAEARAAFVERLDEIGHDDPLLRGELRRFLPYAYILSAPDRDWLDESELSPLHRDLRDLAQTFVAARADPGAPIGRLPSHQAIVAWLPLPWSIELAVLLAESGDERGLELAAALSGWIGAAAHRELRRVRERVPELTRAADSILSVVPGPPVEVTEVRVCGPETMLSHGGVSHAVSRRRVRQALQLLALRPAWSRAAIGHALWPDLDEAKAAANLRSTLRHLRLALEPSREPGEADFHLRHRHGRLTLHRSDWLDVDVWQLDDLLADGKRAESAGRVAAAIECRTDALAMWSRDALSEVREIPEVDGVVADLEHRVLAAGSWAGERQLSLGDHAAALATADRLLEIDSLSERAHDIRVGAHLAAGDLDAAASSVHELVEAAETLGVAPSSGSEMLIRRYERRSGRPAHRSRGSTAG